MKDYQIKSMRADNIEERNKWIQTGYEKKVEMYDLIAKSIWHEFIKENVGKSWITWITWFNI